MTLFPITRKDGGEPCGECHLQPGETCDICGAYQPRPFGDGPYGDGHWCTHHPDDPAHGPECYRAPTKEGQS